MPGQRSGGANKPPAAVHELRGSYRGDRHGAPPSHPTNSSRHADMALDDGLGGSPYGSVVNPWQLNLQAIRAERCHQFALRPNASAWASVSLRRCAGVTEWLYAGGGTCAAPGDSMRASPAGVRHRALANCAERREGLLDFPPRSPLSATALVPDRGRADFIDAAHQEFPN